MNILKPNVKRFEKDEGETNFQNLLYLDMLKSTLKEKVLL